MIKHFEAKGDNLSFKLDNSFPRLTAQDQEAIQSHWKVKTEVNPNMFNGEVFCCNEIKTGWGGKLEFSVNKSDYATYVWAKENRRKGIVGIWPMGDCVIPYEPHVDSYSLAKRSKKGVTFDQGKYSGFGGVISYDSSIRMGNFVDYLIHRGYTELTEETEYQNLGQLRVVGGYIDTDTKKVEFLHGLSGRGFKLRGTENASIVSVTRASMCDFYHANIDSMETSTGNHLKYWAPKMSRRPLVGR